MALINIPSDHMKLTKTLSIEKKPLMLKDYLRDDLSSCSSSGFKSFPRRQCCTTVRFHLESDLKKSKGNYSSTTKRLLKSRSCWKPGSTTISALQRASEAVLNAVKLLPFPSIKPSSPSLKSNSSRKGHLPRSFSRKLFKRSFWTKADKEDHGEVRRWKLFREFLEEKNQRCDQNTITNANTTADTSSTTILTSRVSTTRSSNSNSWAESEFTADVLQSSSGNSERSIENGVDGDKTNLPVKKKVSNIVGVTVDEDSINLTKEQDWPNEEGKEQFSPVSVLDCPFDDEEENNSSPFEGHLARVEGTKQKFMQKIRRFEILTQLEPVDLEKRIALAELEEESLESPKEICSVSVNNNGNMSINVDKQEKDREANEKLLKLLKAKIPSDSFKLKADNLMLDFFRERLLMVEDNAKRLVDMGLEEFGLDIFRVAEDWVNGKPQELGLGWEVQEGRKVNVKEMERNENWRNLDEEKEEVGLAVEHEVFSWLVDELLTDLF